MDDHFCEQLSGYEVSEGRRAVGGLTFCLSHASILETRIVKVGYEHMSQTIWRETSYQYIHLEIYLSPRIPLVLARSW